MGGIIQNYFGTTFGLLIIIIWLLILYNNRDKAEMKYVLSASIIFIITIPLLYKICEKFNMLDVFYRFLWLFPLSLMSSYIAVKIIQKQYTIYVILLICLFWFGNIYIDWQEWRLPDNMYKISNDVIEAVEIIENDSVSENIKVVGEIDFMGEVRQYSAKIHWGYPNALYMIEGTIVDDDASTRIANALYKAELYSKTQIFEDLQALDISYIVLYQNNPFIDQLPLVSYEIVGETEKYIVIRVKLK